jgi:AcrR family transcriptional regulator
MPRKKAEKKSAPYHAHRERQRRRILDAAWALFDERGIDRVTMADIVAGSEIQPSTMYQYFANKDEIVWELLREVMTEAAGEAQRRIEGAPDALGRLSALFEFVADELSRRPVRARFMAQFDALYAHDWPAERLLSLESQINPQGFQYFSDLVREGIADGSLRPDLDPDLTMHAIMNAVIGSQRRLASLGSKVELEYGKPVDQLFRETVRILLLGLRAPAPAAGTAARKRTKARTSSRKRSS